LNGWEVEAVRTELPFFHRERLTMENEALRAMLPADVRHAATIQGINMDFSGRADLVLAMVSEGGEGALQVVDLKTRGCLQKFNEQDHRAGHALQKNLPETTSTQPIGDEEIELLHEHRLQLTLYSMALEAMENKKPAAQRRRVLPPALLLGANGRMVQLSDQQFESAKNDLLEHLQWRSAVHLNPSLPEPPRLAAGSELCRTCPFYRGDLRRCAPEGEPLGFPSLMDGSP